MTHRVTRVVPAVLAAALVALLAASTWLWWDRRSEADPAAEVIARRQAINFFSLDYRHIDADLDRVLALSTGEFRKQYADQRDRVRQGVAKQKLVVTAEVPESGTALEYQHDDAAQVLVAVDATTSGRTVKETNRYRVRLGLRKVDGQWLVSQINQVG
jgi:hypothetical protein